MSNTDDQEKFLCPRRAQERGAEVPSDYWRKEGQDLRVCSYDGSIHPEDFMELLRLGTEIEPTDKSYKFYLRELDQEVRGAAKFYTHHFALFPDLGDEFVRLNDADKIKWGYPGYAYVPLFIPRNPVQEDSTDKKE